MKTLLKLILPVALTLLSSCASLYSEKEGTIKILFMKGNSITDMSLSDIPNADDFILAIATSSGSVIYQGRFGDSPEELTVSPGTYIIAAQSEYFDQPEFDKPIYGDEQTVVVESGSIVTVQLNCRQINSGIRLIADNSFIEVFPDSDFLIENQDGSLTQSYDDSRIAFFRPGSVTVSVNNNGIKESLFTRTLIEQQILQVNISASVSSSGSISLQIDTSRTWTWEDYVYGDNDASSIYNAMTVTEAREHTGEEDVWVYGYIVGEAVGSKNINFTPPFEKGTNIALGLRSSTTNIDYCITVELQKGSTRDALNLVSNPDLKGKRVYLKGDMVEAYYGIPGLKNISEYQLD